jgi:hypothetical protein
MENPPEITFEDGVIAISSIAPISAETIQKWDLQPGHTVSLKFTTLLFAAKLAEFLEQHGAPAKGETSFDWATKIVKALGEQGLRKPLGRTLAFSFRNKGNDRAASASSPIALGCGPKSLQFLLAACDSGSNSLAALRPRISAVRT